MNDKVGDKQCVKCGEPASFTIKNPATVLYYCADHYFQEPSVAKAPDSLKSAPLREATKVRNSGTSDRATDGAARQAADLRERSQDGTNAKAQSELVPLMTDDFTKGLKDILRGPYAGLPFDQTDPISVIIKQLTALHTKAVVAELESIIQVRGVGSTNMTTFQGFVFAQLENRIKKLQAQLSAKEDKG